MSKSTCECGRLNCSFPDCIHGAIEYGTRYDPESRMHRVIHPTPCECPACQAGAYCNREIERIANHCGA